MKYAIMSDVHSNPSALQAALEDAKSLHCGRFLFLGDVTGYGYDVEGALKLVRDNFDVAIRGNHDAICCGLEDDAYIQTNPHYDVDRAQGRILSDDDKAWLQKRRLTYHNHRYDFACTHGDFVAPAEWGYIMDPEEAMINFDATGEQLLFCGHLHHAMVVERTPEGPSVKEHFVDQLNRPARAPESITFTVAPGSRYIVNCGSVGNPRCDLCMTYAIYDTARREVTLRRLPFDFKGYVTEMLAHKVQFPGWLDQLVRAALKYGGETMAV